MRSGDSIWTAVSLAALALQPRLNFGIQPAAFASSQFNRGREAVVLDGSTDSGFSQPHEYLELAERQYAFCFVKLGIFHG